MSSKDWKGTKFVILSSQRSGSTWLVSLINKMENTLTYGELFLNRQKDTEKVQRSTALDYPRFIESHQKRSRIRPFSVFSYLNRLYSQLGHVGFKLMYTQLFKYPELLAYCILRRIKIVHLVRQNTLDVVLSEAIKKETHQAHLLSDQPEPAQIQVRLDTQTLIQRLVTKQDNVRTARKILYRLRLPVLEVTYEDLKLDPACFQSICQFLSIHFNGSLPTSNLVKIQRNNHADVIRNYAEVKVFLAGTPFAHLLEQIDPDRNQDPTK